MKKLFVVVFFIVFIVSALVTGGVLLGDIYNQISITESGVGFDNSQNENEDLSSQFSGSGTSSSPYLIQNSSDLNTLASNINNGIGNRSYYRQTANIAVSSFNVPIGNSTNPFSGYYDGDGYIISGINLTVSYSNVGLFGYTVGATIHDLGLVDCNFSGFGYVGGIVGYAGSQDYFATTIYNCFNAGGSVTVTEPNSPTAGGICGLIDSPNRSSGYIHHCYNSSTITATIYGGTLQYLGGIVGRATATGAYAPMIHDCYNTGAISGYSIMGGICGESQGMVSNCYNTGTFSGYRAGGICGNSDSGYITNCFNSGNFTLYGGAIVGGYCGGVSNCYFSHSSTGYGNGPSSNDGCTYLNGNTSAFYDVDSDVYGSWDISTGTSTDWRMIGSYSLPVLADLIYYIAYSLNSGSLSIQTNYACFGSVLYIPNPTRSGYSFTGWTATNLGTALAKQGPMPNQLSSWSNGDTKITSQYFKDLGLKMGSTVTLKANWQMNSYTFTAQFQALNATNSVGLKVAFPFISSIAYNIIDAGKSAQVNQSQSSSTKNVVLSLYNSASSTGSFNVVYYMKIGSTPTLTDYDMIFRSKNDTYTVEWTPTTNKTILVYISEVYVFDYYSSYGSSSDYPAPQNVLHNTSVKVAKNDIERQGYSPDGWTTSSSGTGTHYYEGNTIVITSRTTLYAQWEPNTYKVTLESHNNNESPKYIYLKYGDAWYNDQNCQNKIETVTPPTKTGYIFAGYFEKENGEGATAIASDGSINASNIQIYTDGVSWHAHWIPKNEAIYDKENDYWYVEMGYFPQSKVTNESDISELESLKDAEETNGNVYTLPTKQLEENMTQWEVYRYTNNGDKSTLTIEYDNEEKVNRVHLIEMGGGCIFGTKVQVQPNKCYTISFNCSYSNEMAKWLRLQVLYEKPTQDTNPETQLYFDNLNQDNSFTFNSGNYEELYIVFNTWYIEDVTYDFTFSNFSFKLDGQEVYGTKPYDAYTYKNDEYVRYNGSWFKVEPVKYVLAGDYSSNYATESGNVTAVSEKIVFASVFQTGWTANDCLGKGYAYAQISTNVSGIASEEYMESDELSYLNSETYSVANFKMANGTKSASDITTQAIASSESEIQSVFGDLSAEFSDLVADILGGYLYYWTRDVGSNLNNAQTISAGGITGTQMKMQEILGVRVTVNVKTIVCK